jgi:thioredoxin reductase
MHWAFNLVMRTFRPQPVEKETTTALNQPTHMIRLSKYQFQRSADTGAPSKSAFNEHKAAQFKCDVSTVIVQNLEDPRTFEVQPEDPGTDSDVCLICMERQFNTVLIECGHR